MSFVLYAKRQKIDVIRTSSLLMDAFVKVLQEIEALRIYLAGVQVGK